MTDKELMHYGVLGMHWGRRKRVPDSPEVSTLKRRIGETKTNLKKEKKIYMRKTGYGMVVASTKDQARYTKAIREVEYAKDDLRGVKILEKVNAQPKSKSQLKMEAKYQKQGMTKDEATIEAYKHIRTRNILLAVGGTAVVVGAGYAAYKIHDSRVDKIIKSGSLIQNISGNNDQGVRDAFYGATNRLDKEKYKGIYGDTLIKKNGQAVQKNIKVISDIKQASPKNAQKTLEDLLENDRAFAAELKSYMNKQSGQFGFGAAHINRFKIASNSMDIGKFNDKNLYEAFNVALVDHDPAFQPLTDKYFGELTKRGYNAIRDVNDSKYSGYKTFNPIIAFNASGKLDVVDIKKLTLDQVAKSKKIGYAHIVGTELVTTGSVVAGGILATNKLEKMTMNKATSSAVAKYRKRYPGTKMSTTEIARMIERSR